MYMQSVLEKKPYSPKTMKSSMPHEGPATSYSSSFSPWSSSATSEA